MLLKKKPCKLKKKQGFWKLITTLDQCARSSTPLSVVRTARHYHGTSSNLPATKRKQLKSSFFCLPTMLHWTCQCKQNVKFTKSRGIIWHIKLPAYTVDCQWWLSESHLGMIPRGLCSFWYLGLYMAFYLERALKCCKEPLWTFQGVFHFNIIDGPYWSM